MNLDSFTGPGSTPSRRRFWDKVTQAVIASQKIAGKNVTVDERQGMGTVINVPFDNRGRPQPGGVGACCYDDGTCDDLTEADCNDAGGNWQGSDTPCSEGLCVGVCCECSGCVDNSTPDSCAADGGTFGDFQTTCADDPAPCPDASGACCSTETSNDCHTSTEADCTGTYFGDCSTCDPNPCPSPTGACCTDGVCSILSESDCTDGGGNYLGDDSTCDFPSICCACGFDAFDGSGRKFLHKESTCTYTLRDDYSVLCPAPGTTRYDDKNYTTTTPYTADYDPDTCAFSSSNAHFTRTETLIDCDGVSFPQTPVSGTTGDSSCVGCGFTFGCSSSTSTTATTRILTVTFAGGGGFPVATGSGTFTETLSNECSSGGSVFSDPFFQNN